MRIRPVSFLFFALAFVSIFITMSVSAQIVTDGLISYWTFDNADISGETVEDVIGDNDGTMVADTKVVGGKIGQALEFDGDGDYVNCGDHESLEVSSAFTLEAWLNVSDFGHRTFIAKWDDDANHRGYMLNLGEKFEINAADEEVAVVFDPQGTWAGHFNWATGIIVDADRWYHVVLTHDSALDQNNVKVYIDGTLEAQRDWQNTVFQSKANFLIGGYDGPGNGLNGGGDSRFWSGKIDEVCVYDRALSEEEVAQNFAAVGGPAAVDSAHKLAFTWGEVKVSR